MQHVDMERMALNPLPTIDQPPKSTQRSINSNTTGILHGMDCTHLIGNGTNATDASGDIRSLGEYPSPQECFKEAGRLEDL